MSSTTILITILGALMLGAMSPGPSFVMVSRLAISRSRSDGIAAAFGIGLGALLFGTMAISGLTALLIKFSWLYVALKFAGGVYLLYLARQIWSGADRPMASDFEVDEHSPILRSFWAAFLTHVSNPKVIVVYASIFAAMLPAQTSLHLILELLAGIFCIEVGWYVLVALVFSSSRPRALYLRARSWVDRAASCVLTGLGIRLVYLGLSDRS